MITAYAAASSGHIVRSSAVPMNFPAGEAHVQTHGAAAETPVYVYLTGADANDYLTAAMWIDYAHQAGHKIKAVIPYLPGARQDRGVPFGAKVYADMINAMHADEVICFDPHSPVMPALVNNLKVVGAEAVITRAVRKNLPGYVGVICPDKGARARSAVTAKALGLPLFHAEKHRDFATGKLSGFSCEELPAKGRFLVVDDICDGGGTFMGLAAATGLGPDRLDLWVSHGVFSGKAAQLREAFGTIYTTDSHPGAANPAVGARITSLLPHLV